MMVNFNKNVKDWSYEERLRNVVVFITVCVVIILDRYAILSFVCWSAFSKNSVNSKVLNMVLIGLSFANVTN